MPFKEINYSFNVIHSYYIMSLFFSFTYFQSASLLFLPLQIFFFLLFIFQITGRWSWKISFYKCIKSYYFQFLRKNKEHIDIFNILNCSTPIQRINIICNYNDYKRWGVRIVNVNNVRKQSAPEAQRTLSNNVRRHLWTLKGER